MSRAAVIFPCLIFALVAPLAAYAALEYTWTALIFPVGAALLVCALCAVEILSAATSRGPAQPVAGEEPVPLSLPSMLWIFALAPFLYGLGFVLGPACYLLAYLRASGFSWRFSAAIAAASVLVTWGLFVKAMGILLPVVPLWMA